MSPILLGAPPTHSDDWHAMRASGIGASEIAAVLGLNPWQSAFTLWHRKAGMDADHVDNAATHWGGRLEAVVCDEWGQLNPWADLQPGAVYARHDEPWMRAIPDRLVVDGETTVAVLEAKTARFADGWGPDGSDEVPVYYRAQVVQQMHVMEVPVGYVAVLIGGSDFRTYTIDYDPAEAAVLVDAGRAFWQSVLDGVPPDVDGSTSTGETVRRLHPDVDDVDAMIPADLADEYRRAVAAARAADAAKDAAANRLLAAMGSARVAVDPDGVKVATRSVSTPKRFDRKAFAREYPDLDRKFTVTGDPSVRLTPSIPKETTS